MMSNLYKMFASDSEAELDGIMLNYGDVKFLIARAGGANKKFSDVFKEEAKPYRYAIDHNQLSEDDSARIMATVYAKAVVLGWESVKKDKETGKPETNKDGTKKWHKFVEDKDGNLMPFNTANCVKLLTDLPELFRDIQRMANEAANFRKEEEEADKGNLSES